MNAIFNNIITGVYLIITVGPVIISVAKFYGTKTHNQRILNLAARADIIVGSLQNANIPGIDKKQIALNSMANYAKDAKIKLTPDQASEYIENAVRISKDALSVVESVTDDAKPTKTN